MSEPTPEPPVKGMKVIPYGLPLMGDAWAGCMMWAIGKHEVRQVFTEETGLSLEDLVCQSGFARMIDEATGYRRDVVMRFLDWATERLWGIDGLDEEIESKQL